MFKLWLESIGECNLTVLWSGFGEGRRRGRSLKVRKWSIGCISVLREVPWPVHTTDVAGSIQWIEKHCAIPRVMTSNQLCNYNTFSRLISGFLNTLNGKNCDLQSFKITKSATSPGYNLKYRQEESCKVECDTLTLWTIRENRRCDHMTVVDWRFNFAEAFYPLILVRPSSSPFLVKSSTAANRISRSLMESENITLGKASPGLSDKLVVRRASLSKTHWLDRSQSAV